MFKQGIPLAAFEVEDIEAEANRLKKGGVKLRGVFLRNLREPAKIAARWLTLHLFTPFLQNAGLLDAGGFRRISPGRLPIQRRRALQTPSSKAH